MSHASLLLRCLSLLLLVTALATGCGRTEAGGDGEKVETPGSDLEQREGDKPLHPEAPGSDVEHTDEPKPLGADSAGSDVEQGDNGAPAEPAATPPAAEPPTASIPEPGDLPGQPIAGELVVTDSGLRYYDLVVGDGPMPPGRTTAVLVDYTGWLTDGTKFDSSVDRGVPAGFLLGTVIPGWTEGVGGMHIGGSRKLVIPSDLAYGPRGRPGIPPNATLVFDVDLLPPVDVAVPDPLPGEPVDGPFESTFAGVKYHDLREGDGPQPSGLNSVVSVHYTAWLTDGTKFDSSHDRGQPLQLPLGRFVPGWADAVSSMKVGGRRKIIIPWQLGYSDRGMPPVIPSRADLVFDVELLDVIDMSK